MRKILFAVLASSAILAVAPATALAHHHQRSHQRSRHHHARVHRKSFGSDEARPGGINNELNAGTVMSFTGGVLTIELADNTTVSGRITSATELVCEASASQMVRSHDEGSGGGDNGGGDDNGQANNDGEGEQMCTTAALIPGTTVRGAELDVTGAGAVWEKVELITA